MQTTPQQQLGDLQLRREIRDLGAVDPHLEGILSPGYRDSEVSSHIHDEFLEKADQFLTFCPIDRALIEHWKDLISAAINPYLTDGPLNVLDIGSGGGTSVFPILELLPNARVFATDLSLPLLSQLRNRARRDGLADRLTVMQMNAEDMFVADAQADVIMGANVLHHAVSPEQALTEVRRVLKPHGVAVFWEPFEGGAQINASIFGILLEANENCVEKLPVGMTDAMREFTADLVRRRSRNKPLEVLLSLDDKWYFTHRWIGELAASAGFARCEIRNCYDTFNVVWVMVCHELARSGHNPDLLPGWAREKVLTLQDRYSDDWLAENLYEAAIVLEGKRGY
jgi:ubiquinone/menaquinone biosynthesis C-methylase UbiE